MRHARPAVTTLILAAVWASPVYAQQRISDVLSFLLTNRSVATGDFARDEQAAEATRDAIAVFLRNELSTVPISSPASGFTYRLDRDLGVNVRSTNSFGPFFLERSLTGGQGQISFGVGYMFANFDDIDGRPLGDGTLVATASRLTGAPEPFDAETLTLHLETRTVTISGEVGVSDRLDVAAALPFQMLRLDGTRVDTYRGQRAVQATAVSSAFGLGDVRLRAKYNVLRQGGSGIAAALDLRVPTGNVDNLLGGGHWVMTPRLVASIERERAAFHGNLGVATGGRSREADYSAAVTLAGSPRFTVVAELIGRRLESGGRLAEVVEAHPGLIGVETIRLVGTPQPTTRASVAAGIRWNVAAKWLVSMSVLRPLTTAGLNARWVPSITFDYAMDE